MNTYHRFRRQLPLILVTAVIVLFMLTLHSLGQQRGRGEVFTNPTPTPTPGRSREDFDDPTPTPTPTPDERLKNALKQTREATERELNADGPQASTSSRNGSFSMTAFIRAGWPLVVDYRAEEGARVELVITTLNDYGFNFWRKKLEGTDIGDGVMRASLTIPDRWPQLQPGSISVTAKIKKPEGGSRVAKFSLLSMTCGVRDSEPVRRPERRRASFQLYGESMFQLVKATFTPDESAIQFLQFAPEIIETAQRQKIAYRFVPASTFALWAADFSVITFGMKDGIEIAKPKVILTQKFTSEITRGNEVRGEWDGLNKRGRVSVGPHQMAIRAWWTAASAGSGASSYGSSDRVFTVR